MPGLRQMQKASREFVARRRLIKTRVLAMILTGVMAWTYFIPKRQMYEMAAVAGGITGSVFIFLVPVLLYFRSKSGTALLEQRLNESLARHARKDNFASLKQQETESNKSYTNEESLGEVTRSGRCLTLVLSILGLACFALPIATVAGLLHPD